MEVAADNAVVLTRAVKSGRRQQCYPSNRVIALLSTGAIDGERG